MLISVPKCLYRLKFATKVKYTKVFHHKNFRDILPRKTCSTKNWAESSFLFFFSTLETWLSFVLTRSMWLQCGCAGRNSVLLDKSS